MDKLERWLEVLYEQKISNEFDRIVVVLGDEGMGKSTLILELSLLWNEIIGADETPEELIERMVWERDEYTNAIVENPKQSVIPVPDGARILFKKDAMNPEQKDVQKDMLQSRVQENLVLLGFQYWGDIPSFLQNRRAHNILRIPSRGRVEGYSRTKIDKRNEKDYWPKPDLRDSFPDLEETDIWRKYKQIDQQKKLELMADGDDDDEEKELSVKEIAADIRESGVTHVISENPSNDQLFIDADLIEVEYGIPHTKAKKVRKVLRKQVDLDRFDGALV